MQVKRSHHLHFSASIDAVFPLFTPVHEKHWAQDWNPIFIHRETPTAEEQGAVFTTQHPGEPLATWIIADYDGSAHRIKYVKVVPEVTMTLIEIQCSGNEETIVEVSYRMTALGEAGYRHVHEFTEDYFRFHQMATWQRAINDYLTTGRSHATLT